MTERNRDDTERSNSEPSAPNSGTFAKRDYFLIPLISVLTVIAMLAIAEVLTRTVWNAHEEDSCVIIGDPIDGYRIKPNCTARTKSAEGTWATYHFNECGYRSNTSCGPVAPGTLRIAILG